MISSKRWLNVGALTVILVMVWASSLWAPYHRFDYSQIDRVMNLNRKSILLIEKGKYQEALKPAKEALRLAKRIYADNPEHDNVEVLMQNLAMVYKGLGRYSEAEPIFKQILETDEALVGPNDPEVARSLNNLAALYSAQGRYSEAEPLHKRALAIQEKVFGPDHPAVARSLNNLAELYKAQGQHAKAEPFQKRTLATREKALGSSDPGVTQSLNKLALLYKKQGQYAKAEPLYKRALANQEKALGPDHPRVANMLKNLATLYREMGRDEEAKKLLTRSKRSALGISKSSGKVGNITPTELIQAMEEKEGIRFKVMMTSGVEDNNPIDFKTQFSVNDDDKMYVHVYWSDMVGDHRVTVIWITPDQEIYAYNIYDSTFKEANWNTWPSQKIFKNIPTGVWTFELYLDGKPLVAKKFNVTPDKVDETKKLLVRAKRSARGIYKSSEKIGEITPTKLIQEMEEKEGIRFKVTMTSGIEKHRPIDFKSQFSVNDDDMMYVHVYWPHRVGDHRVTVIWITPDQVIFYENILDMTFKYANWKTWHWNKMYKAMPKGDWTFALLLDGKHLVTKKFTVTN